MKVAQIQMHKQHTLNDVESFMNFCGDRVHPITKRHIDNAVASYTIFMDSQDELSEDIADLLARGIRQICQDELVNIGSYFWG